MKYLKYFEELTGKYKDEFVTIYRDKTLLCMLPKSQMASKLYGQKTNWCQVTQTGFNNWTNKNKHSLAKNALIIRFLFKNGRKIRFTYFDDDTYYWTNEKGYHILQGTGDPFEAASKRKRVGETEFDVFDLIKQIPNECRIAVNEFIEDNKKDFEYIYRDDEYLTKKEINNNKAKMNDLQGHLGPGKYYMGGKWHTMGESFFSPVTQVYRSDGGTDYMKDVGLATYPLGKSTNNDESVAFKKGQEAYDKGLTKEENPYIDQQYPNTTLIKAWDDGWENSKLNNKI